jgi:hypothetical protein
MNKTDAVSLFGRQVDLSKALGVTQSAISQWPDSLDQAMDDRVVGAALRIKVLDPAGIDSIEKLQQWFAANEAAPAHVEQ